MNISHIEELFLLYRSAGLASKLKCLSTQNGHLEWNIDPSKVLCVQDCFSYDSGQYKVTKIGETRKLISIPGYEWQDDMGKAIKEVKCEIKELGNHQYVGEEQFHQLADINECQDGIGTVLCPMKNSQCYNVPGNYQCICDETHMPFDNSGCKYRKIIINCSYV